MMEDMPAQGSLHQKPQKRQLAADERRFMQINHAVYAPKPFTLLAGWRIQAAY
jgi:hypothetical protein